MLLMMYSDDVCINRYNICFCVKIIYYLLYFIPLRWLDFDVGFVFSSSTSSSLTQMVRISVPLELIEVE